MLAREKPHCGISGVPFMKRTTGAEATALSIAARVSVERKRDWRSANREERRGFWRGRRVRRKTDANAVLVAMIGYVFWTDRIDV